MSDWREFNGFQEKLGKQKFISQLSFQSTNTNIIKDQGRKHNTTQLSVVVITSISLIGTIYFEKVDEIPSTCRKHVTRNIFLNHVCDFCG